MQKRAERVAIGDQLLEASEGVCFWGPAIQLGTESHLNGLVEKKLKLALVWEAKAGRLELGERFLRHKRTQRDQDCENSFCQSIDLSREPANGRRNIHLFTLRADISRDFRLDGA